MKITNKKQALKFLKKQFLMQIATSYKDKPAAAVMLYAIDDDFNIYFTTHKDSRKAQNLLKNPNISLAIWKHKEALIQADGKITVVKENQEEIIDKLADAATEDDNFWPPLFRIQGDEYIIFKITLSWARILDLERDTIRQEDTPFIELKI